MSVGGSGNSGRYVSYSGVNCQGNSYKAYNDGAYKYTNSGSESSGSSKYYNTGKGHGFYSRHYVV